MSDGIRPSLDECRAIAELLTELSESLARSCACLMRHSPPRGQDAEAVLHLLSGYLAIAEQEERDVESAIVRRVYDWIINSKKQEGSQNGDAIH